MLHAILHHQFELTTWVAILGSAVFASAAILVGALIHQNRTRAW